ncbi:unnamed protein product, partial [Prorocentrum cordatum]
PRQEQRSVPPRGGAPQQTEREAMVREVFRLCDLDGDGFLAQAEMCAFARETGFDGSDQDWQEEYGALCEEHGQDPAVGVPVELLARLVDDDSDNGCHCTDSELKEMLERLSRSNDASADVGARGVLEAKSAWGLDTVGTSGPPVGHASGDGGGKI